MSAKSIAGSAVSIVAPQAAAPPQPLDKWLPGATHQVYQACVNLTPAQIMGMNAAAVNIIPAPGPNNFIIIKYARIYLTDVPLSTGFAGGFPIGAPTVSGFSTSGMNTITVNQAVGQSWTGGGAISLQYSNAGAFNAALVGTTTVAVGFFTGAVFPSYNIMTPVTLAGGPPANTPVAISNAAGAFTLNGNSNNNRVTVIVEYEIVSGAA